MAIAQDTPVVFRDVTIPAHVPDRLVSSDYPFVFGMTTERDPFNDLAASVHEGPDIIYALRAYPGAQPAWVPRKAEDLRKIWMDSEHFSSLGGSVFADLLGESWVLSPANQDPPEHGPFRSIVSPVFTPKAVAQLADKVRLRAYENIARFAAHGSCEFMSEFAFEFPVRIFLDLMGLPQERMQEFLEWERDLIHNHDVASITQTARNVVSYLREAIEEHRSNPRDDLLTFAVQAQKNGAPLTEDELMGFAFNLFIGGLDTVATNLGLQFLHLATHPEDQARLRANPAAIPNAIEEMMRAYGSISLFRTCVKATEVNGVQIMPGDRVALSATLGGRDANEFPDPAAVRFDRRPRHFNFGFGAHLCLGRHLALREMRVAMEEFFTLVPTFRLAEGHVPRYTLGLIQPIELPLVW